MTLNKFLYKWKNWHIFLKETKHISEVHELTAICIGGD